MCMHKPSPEGEDVPDETQLKISKHTSTATHVLDTWGCKEHYFPVYLVTTKAQVLGRQYHPKNSKIYP